jgi:hypothetical protein
LEKFLVYNDIKITDGKEEEEKIIVDIIKKRMKEILTIDVKEKKIRHKIELIDQAMLVNE